MTDIQSNDLTTENLDRIAKQLQADRRKPADKQQQWDERFQQLAQALIDHFDDGPEVILQCKIADQMTRMFEKITYNLVQAGTDAKRERRDLIRDDVGIEITKNKVQDMDDKIDMMRDQYWIANRAYKLMRFNVRPATIGRNGVNWSQYLPAAEMTRVKRVQLRKNQLTMETYEANRDDFWTFARETGLVEMPRDDSHATSTD